MRTAKEILESHGLTSTKEITDIIDAALDEAVAHGMTISSEIVDFDLPPSTSNYKAIITARDNKVWRNKE